VHYFHEEEVKKIESIYKLLWKLWFLLLCRIFHSGIMQKRELMLTKYKH